MLEKTIERHLVDGVKRLGGLCVKFVSPGTPGVPDRIIITATGKIIFVELKTETGRLAKIQRYTIEQMMRRGADVRVIKGLDSVKELLAEIGGMQVCVLAVDAKQTDKGWRCYLNGGRVETDKELFAWTKEAQERGVGEILFTSMNHDGVKTGYANEALSDLADGLSIPIIASGGAGAKEHFRDVFLNGKADAALAASVFHFGEIKIPELKSYLCAQGIAMRR